MNHTLLCQWLELQVTSWPPEPAVLLGLSPGQKVAAEEAERLAQIRFERLRPHQLLYPELVSEGMNLLAQAVLQVSLPTTSTVQQQGEDDSESVSQVLEADDEHEPAVEQGSASSEDVLIAPNEPLSAPAQEPISLQVPLPPGLSLERIRRRAAYKTLAELRRFRALWERIGLVICASAESLQSAESVYLTFAVQAELATMPKELSTGKEYLQSHGNLVLNCMSQPLCWTYLVNLLPEQRASVVADWTAERTQIESMMHSLRRILRMYRRKPTLLITLHRTLTACERHRAWIGFGAIVLILIVAIIRSYPKL